MFNSGKKKEVTAQSLQNEKISTIIASDVTVHGGIEATDAIRIDGTVEGDVHVKEALIVGKGAAIRGNVTASGVALAGEIQGNIDAGDGLVTLSDTARIVGDITTGKIVIDENAYFKGHCNMPEAAPEETAEAAQ